MTTPELNPYRSPEAFALPPTEDGRARTREFATRLGLYLGCGATLCVAFCSPLNPLQVMFWEHGPNLTMCGFVMLTSFVSGWLLELLVRMNWPSLLAGGIYAVVNAWLFAVTILTIPGLNATGTGRSLNPLEAILVGSLFGMFYAMYCMHLAIPISVACAYWAKRVSPRTRGTAAGPA